MFLLFPYQIRASSLFLEECNSPSPKTELIGGQLSWIKTLYGSKDCNFLFTQIKSLKTFAELIPSGINENNSIFKPYQLKGSLISEEKHSSEWLRYAKFFTDLTLFKEFTNLKHYSFAIGANSKLNICELVAQVPSIESITISYLDKDDIKCVQNNDLKIYIVGQYPFSDDAQELRKHIVGIDDYVGRIEDLRHYRNLNYLGMNNYSGESSLRELTNTKSLTNLRLNIKNIKNPQDIGSLQTLIFLSLYCSDSYGKSNSECSSKSLTDISFINDLQYLKGLDLSLNQIEEINELTKLKKLEYLNLRKNKIKKLPSIEVLKRLRYLDLSNNLIQEIDSIKHARKLEFLNLANNNILKIANLSAIKSLKFASIGNNLLSDLEKYTPGENLKYLSLGSQTLDKPSRSEERWIMRKIAFDLEEKNWAENLIFENISHQHSFQYEKEKTLDINFDINFKNFSKLEMLILSNINFKTPPKLETVKGLKYLDMSYTKYKHLGSIQLPKGLLFLNLKDSENLITHSNINEIKTLIHLDISKNLIDSTIELDLPNLNSLAMNNCNLYEVPKLNNTQSLIFLEIENNNLNSFSVTDLPDLYMLSLHGNYLEEIPKFYDMANLKYVTITRNKIFSFENHDINPEITFDLDYNPIEEKKPICPKDSPNASIRKFCNSEN